MSQLALTPASVKRAKLAQACRVCVGLFAGTAFVAVLLHTFSLTTFQIPTGSMAPHLLGRHRVCVCPRCGGAVAVGRHAEDRDGTGESRFYRKICCQHCSLFPIPMNAIKETPGDNVVVNTLAYRLRTPARWEVVVFRLFGSYFVKRLLGLPGEEILIFDGDVYINSRLCRKTLAEAHAQRVSLYDQRRAGSSAEMEERWESEPPGDRSVLDGRERPATLTYCNFDSTSGKCKPIRDEYAYNAGMHAGSECVHDFLVACEIDVLDGAGDVVLQLCDGGIWAGVRLPIGAARPIRAFAEPLSGKRQDEIAQAPRKQALTPGRHAIEMAFVDRRLSLMVGGVIWLETDLPEPGERVGVERPFRIKAHGARVALNAFQLFRDLHYGQQGVNGVKGKAVRLDAGQYFVLGDNSPRSEDSRHWPNAGQVSATWLIGPVQRRISGGTSSPGLLPWVFRE